MDGFDEEGAGVGGDGGAQGVDVAVGDDLEAGGEGAEAVLILLAGGEADDGDRPAVEVVVDADDLLIAIPDALDLRSPAPGRGLPGRRPCRRGR